MKHLRSTRDTHEIHQNEHDEALDARRVVLVGGGSVNMDIDTSKVTDSITEALRGFKLDIPTSAQPTEYKTEYKVVEVPVQVFVPQIETKIIEVPVQTIVTEYKVIEVEKPVVTEVLKTIEIEKPIFIEKVIEKTPAWAWSIIISQTMLTIGGIAYYYVTYN